MATPYYFVFVVFLSVLGLLNAKVLIQTRNGTQLEFFATDIIYDATQKPKLEDPISAKVTADRDNVAGQIYVIKSLLSIDEFVVEVQNKGALGVLACSTTFYVPGWLKYRYTDQKYVKQVNITIFEIGYADGIELFDLLAQDEILNVSFIPNDEPNTWDVLYSNPGYIIANMFNVAFSATNIALCIWKLKEFITFYGGFRTSIACYVLLIELIGNIIRVIYMSLAYVGSFPARVSDTFSTISFPLALSSYLLFTLYWHEMMTTSSVVVHPFVVKLRIPFFVCCAALLSLEIIRIILLFTYYWDGMYVLNAAISMIWVVALIAFYMATTIKLLKRLKQSKKLGRLVQLRMITIKVCIGVGFLFAFLVISILFATGFAYYNTGSFTACWYPLYAFINAASMMNILSFELVASGSSKSRSKKASSKVTGTSASAPME